MIQCATKDCPSQATWKIYTNELDYVMTCSNHVEDHKVEGFAAIELFPQVVRTNVYRKNAKPKPVQIFKDSKKDKNTFNLFNQQK